MAHKENICQEQECAESWSALSEDVRNHCTSFIYCPFCANEMVTRCSACGETLTDTDFNYCPWCGEQFE